ncbi:MAG: short-chain dehydrogenase [Phototrophicales bacterium]|nr:MAG: short-chain dehydrogenase [Phototrophicales bacterium]
MLLAEKVAVITGASRGIGHAIAMAFAQEGANVVIASRKQEALDQTSKEIEAVGVKCAAFVTNTGYMEQCKALIDQTLATFGRVDIVVNNAATNPHFGPILTSEPSHWQKIIDVNMMGYFWVSKFAAEFMQENGGGKIINIASIAGIRPGPMMGIYSVSKAAVIMMTKVLAQELGGYNIQVNAIAPGIIKTRFAEALWSNPQLSKAYTDRTPAGRVGEPEEIAGAAVYLASSQSSYHNGDVLVIDGGNSTMGF